MFQYATFLILIVIAEIAAAVLVFVFKDQLGSELETQMQTQAYQDVSANPIKNEITKAWNAMQYEVTFWSTPENKLSESSRTMRCKIGDNSTAKMGLFFYVSLHSGNRFTRISQ